MLDEDCTYLYGATRQPEMTTPALLGSLMTETELFITDFSLSFPPSR